METLLVITNCPDEVCAEHLAQHLVEQGLAACVNILAPCRSVYRWAGKIESAREIPLLIKTTANRYPALEAAIVGNHPYQVPEIIALPIGCGLPAYLDWVALESSTC